jgi:hypothetical protein
MRRDVWKELGSFDERLESGIFDEDYENRVRAAGHRVVRANDVFVHRFGGGFATSGAAEPEPEESSGTIELDPSAEARAKERRKS